MFGCVSCAGPAVHSLGSSRIQRAAVKQSENTQGWGCPICCPGPGRESSLPPSPSTGWDRPLGDQGEELRALGRGLGAADRVCSGMGWYPQGCGQVTMGARVMQLG